ncbi:MAG TPA: xyloglucanase [Longimicrobiaceae bacterium]|nr:xyloglucanase [Longimicrobiaceae bacterium]
MSRMRSRPTTIRTVVIAIAAAAAWSLPAAAQALPPVHSQPYTWKNVQMVGGGFVDGIVFHPTARGVRYARTDMGGAYRWNDGTHRWEPMLDWVSYEDRNLMGVESIALDPGDPGRVYLACGTYTNERAPNGAILRSDDRGHTFERTDVPFKMGGNEDGRGNGERMAVDPDDGRVLYLGTRHDGLWRSTDGAVTWKRVASFPDVTEQPPAGLAPVQRRRWGGNVGIVFVLFDPRGGTTGRPSPTIYAGASLMGRDNLFRSTDGGATWRPVPGQPTRYRPTHAVLASDGMLYVAYGDSPGPSPMTDGAVWRLDTRTGAWTDVTPDRPDPAAGRAFGYAAVAVDAHHPRWLIVSTYDRYEAGGENIFRSTDGGASWRPIFGPGGGTFDFSLAPYVAFTPIHWLFDIEIDPANPDHALFTTGYGGYETFDLTDADAGKPTKWSVMSTGIEETVALDLLSPTRGAPLISAIGDYGGFVHRDLDRPAPEGNFSDPRFANTTSLAAGDGNPSVVVRAGAGVHGDASIGYSLDGGRSWRPAASTPGPDSRLGDVAVSSDGATWIWTPARSAVYVTRDRGATWGASRGIPAGTRVVADRVDPTRFYGMDLFGGRLFVSGDGGASFVERTFSLPGGLPPRPTDPFAQRRGDSRGGQDRLYATPGRSGDLWIAAFDGLYHSTDEGGGFAKLPGVQEIAAFGFGRAAPGAAFPALYLVGRIEGVRGIFRSDDVARSWERINDDRHQWGLILQITGDPKEYGRVYVGTHGRGTQYGDPAGPGG